MEESSFSPSRGFFRLSQALWRIAHCHLAIGPALDVGNRQCLEEWIGADQLFIVVS
jgi:hypothetical protein